MISHVTRHAGTVTRRLISCGVRHLDIGVWVTVHECMILRKRDLNLPTFQACDFEVQEECQKWWCGWGMNEWIRFIVGFPPLMVISPTASIGVYVMWMREEADKLGLDESSRTGASCGMKRQSRLISISNLHIPCPTQIQNIITFLSHHAMLAQKVALPYILPHDSTIFGHTIFSCWTRKTAGAAENPSFPQILCVIYIWRHICGTEFQKYEMKGILVDLIINV